ncbi:MAG: membrane-bound lytic murein transglycosylase MltF [Rhodobacteraceae bacterium]|nr:membrane-bound lytic murein transglycosylase MltF [Paracoccaceae bacterium]
MGGKRGVAYVARTRWPYILLTLLVCAGLMFSLREQGPGTSIEAIQEAGTLVVVTRNSPTTYYLGRDDEPVGFEVDLARDFAATLGVSVTFLPVDSVPEILSMMADGEAHIAAAGLTVTSAREKIFQFAPPYMQVRQIVVCRKGGATPAKIEDLADLRLVVTAGSSYAEVLAAASVLGLTWDEPDISPEALMQAVWEKEYDCTIADEPIFQVTRRHYPELVRAFALTPEEPLAWIVAPQADELRDALDKWFARASTARAIDQFTAAHFSFFPEFDFLDLTRFRDDVAQTLPTFERDLRTAARRNEMPWRLLAAMGYQESKWNPDAVSPTGVRGFMMLTRATAEHIGVADRTDAKESIWGGARYFMETFTRLPDGVTGDDRYWFALAAYNMGLGHVYDARALAEQRGLDKNAWADVKQVLGDLSDEKVYATLRHGYARGYEARRYVEQVRTYWHVLKEQR